MKSEIYEYKKTELEVKIADMRDELKANVNTIHREIERRQKNLNAEWTVWFYKDLRSRCQQFEKNLDKLEYYNQRLVELNEAWDE